MLTTTPRFRPCEGATPSPATRSSPPGMTSATTAITLAVPMSSPTTRSLYSLAISSYPSFVRLAGSHQGGDRAFQSQCVAIGVAQVGVIPAAPLAGRDLRHRAHEAAD